MLPILDAILPIVGKALDRLIPDKAEAAKAKIEIEKELWRHEEALLGVLQKSDDNQATINLEEAKSTDWFKSCWRPALAWVCVLGFTWACLVMPITMWYLAMKGRSFTLPVFPDNVLSDMLWGLLGLGAYRTIEKHPTFARGDK